MCFFKTNVNIPWVNKKLIKFKLKKYTGSVSNRNRSGTLVLSIRDETGTFGFACPRISMRNADLSQIRTDLLILL